MTLVRIWLRAGKGRSLQTSNLLRHLHLFYFTLQKGKENSRHTQKGVNQCSVIDTRRQMGPMYRRFQTYLHMYTQDYAQKIHNMSHMYNGHTKTARHGAFPHVTLPQRTEQENGFSGRMGAMEPWQPGEQRDQRDQQNQPAHVESRAWSRSSSMSIIPKMQDFVLFFKEKNLKI